MTSPNTYLLKASKFISLLALTFLIFIATRYALTFDVNSLTTSNNPIKSNLANANSFLIYLHIWPAAIALLILPIQLVTLGKQLRLHRYLGKTYGLAVVISSISGFILSANAFGGVSSTLALGALSILWFFTTIKAIKYAVKRDITKHKKWIIRSVSLTLAAISLRLLAPIHYELFGLELGQTILYWSCWLINGFIGEVVIFKKFPSSEFNHPRYLKS